jgi:hypothetical protein
MTAFLLYCFSYQSPFLWVYGDGIWGAVAVQAILIGLLFVASQQVSHYHAMAELADIEEINELISKYSADAPDGDSGAREPSSPNPTN